MHTTVRKTHLQTIFGKHFYQNKFFSQDSSRILKRKWSESDLEKLAGKGGESLGQA